MEQSIVWRGHQQSIAPSRGEVDSGEPCAIRRAGSTDVLRHGQSRVEVDDVGIDSSRDMERSKGVLVSRVDDE